MKRITAKAHKHFRSGKSFFTNRHPFIVPVITLASLSFVTFIGFMIFGGGTTVGPSDSKIVNVFVDGSKQTLPTRAQTVEDLLSKLNIEVKKDDVVEPALDSAIFEDNFNINIYRARPLVIVDSGKETVINTANQSARIAARNAGIVVYPEDEVLPTVPEDIAEEGLVGERYVINRATPITLILYGSISPARTQSKTVGELINEKGIKLSDNDTVQPGLDEKLQNNTKVIVTREGQEIATVEEEIPPPVEYAEDANLLLGSEAVKEPGTPGKKVVTYDIRKENGQEVERKLLQEIIAVKPQRKLIVRGTKVVISNPSENVKIGERLAASRGWTGEQFYCLYSLWQKESGWSTTAGNPSSGAYGIPQALPGGKMSSAGSDWATNPATQITWGMGYISGRYGTPCSAWATSQSRGWY